MGRATWSALVAAAAVMGVASGLQCLEKYQCMFHHDINGQEYSWDMHSLCDDYTITNRGNQNFSFSVCGNSVRA